MRLMIAGYLVGRFIGEHLDNFPNEEERWDQSGTQLLLI
jgi:hypothetical protein